MKTRDEKLQNENWRWERQDCIRRNHSMTMSTLVFCKPYPPLPTMHSMHMFTRLFPQYKELRIPGQPYNSILRPTSWDHVSGRTRMKRVVKVRLKKCLVIMSMCWSLSNICQIEKSHSVNVKFILGWRRLQHNFFPLSIFTSPLIWKPPAPYRCLLFLSRCNDSWCGEGPFNRILWDEVKWLRVTFSSKLNLFFFSMQIGRSQLTSQVCLLHFFSVGKVLNDKWNGNKKHSKQRHAKNGAWECWQNFHSAIKKPIGKEPTYKC